MWDTAAAADASTSELHHGIIQSCVFVFATDDDDNNDTYLGHDSTVSNA
jgi:hypothetical protein